MGSNRPVHYMPVTVMEWQHGGTSLLFCLLDHKKLSSVQQHTTGLHETQNKKYSMVSRYIRIFEK
jgi:hypothetical protein